jgi:serine/threonine-protein kinase
MGAVYEAVQISLDRQVAIKVLSKQLAGSRDFVERFHREAKIMAKMDHPNVLRCYAASEDRGLHYFAMEYVEGGSLEGWLKKLGRFTVGDALHVLIACADALQHAHELGLIHRDVKPDNVLLTKKGVVKLADLGLAKATTEDLALTKTGTGAGTPMYMSPEQSRDAKHVDARSDIYALGCMLYAFLVGHPPFRGETVVEVFEAKEKGKFPPARQTNDEVPERLDLIIDKMVARKPEVRYQSCAEVLRDLRGLGLANATLGFLLPEGETPQRMAVPQAPRPGTVGKTVALAEPKGPAKVVVPPNRPLPAKTPAAAGKSSPDDWFLAYKNRDGKPVKRKMTTAQVIEYIREEHFDPRSEAAKTLDGPYRLLASYKEFEGALRGRITKAKADRKTEKFQAIYAKLEKEQVSRERWKWFNRMFRGAVGWVMLIVWIAVIAGALVGLYFVVKIFLLPVLHEWFSKMTK